MSSTEINSVISFFSIANNFSNIFLLIEVFTSPLDFLFFELIKPVFFKDKLYSLIILSKLVLSKDLFSISLILLKSFHYILFYLLDLMDLILQI